MADDDRLIHLSSLSPARSMYPNSALAEVSLITLTGFCGRPEYARHNMRSFQDANRVQPATAHEISQHLH
jgi:hypothetical protein